MDIHGSRQSTPGWFVCGLMSVSWSSRTLEVQAWPDLSTYSCLSLLQILPTLNQPAFICWCDLRAIDLLLSSASTFASKHVHIDDSATCMMECSPKMLQFNAFHRVCGKPGLGLSHAALLSPRKVLAPPNPTEQEIAPELPRSGVTLWKLILSGHTVTNQLANAPPRA